MLQSAEASTLERCGAVKQVQLYSEGRWRLHPEFFLQWHHTVLAVTPSTHLPIITHTSDCSWTSQHCHIMERARLVAFPHKTTYMPMKVCETHGQSHWCLPPILFLWVCLVLTPVVQILSGPENLFVCVFSRKTVWLSLLIFANPLLLLFELAQTIKCF